MFPNINVFGKDIPMYGLMSLLGIVVVAVFAFFWNKRRKLPWDDLLHIVIYCAIGAIIGAKALYLITAIPTIIGNISVILADPILIINALSSGFVFYGGLFGALFMMRLYCRKYSIDLEPYGSLFAIGAPLFHVFGRIGCFFAGCCYGVEVPWGVVFRHSIGAPNGIPLLPVQLIESALNILIFIAVFAYQRKNRRPFAALKLYLICYAVIRFTLEFFRGDEIRGRFLVLSTSQWISVVVIVVCFWSVLRIRLQGRSLTTDH